MLTSKRSLTLVILIVLIAIAVGFVVVNVEIINRLTVVDNLCERRIGEGQFTPDNFKDMDDRVDTTPYLMDSFESVTFPSRDGVTISGFFIPASVSSTASTETVIIVHGFSDCKRRPFSLMPAGMLHRNDMNALVIDLHNHGDSEVTTQRMGGGVDEASDVLGAWDWLVNEQGIPPEKIGLFGYSLGGATIIHAMADEPRIVAGWSDSTFDKMETVLTNELRKEGFPTWLSASALLTGKLLFGVDLEAGTPEQMIGSVGGRPLMIVHSTDDETVPISSAETLTQGLNDEPVDSRIWITDNAGHIEVMFYYTEEYETRLIAFFRQTLNPAP